MASQPGRRPGPHPAFCHFLGKIRCSKLPEEGWDRFPRTISFTRRGGTLISRGQACSDDEWSAPWLQGRADRSSPSSTRRSSSAKGMWAKAPKRGWDLSLPRVWRGEGRPVRKRARARGEARSGISRRRAVARRRLRFVQVDGGRREELRGLAAVLAPGAVAVRVRELLSEVRGEEGGLAAVLGGEDQHLVETGDLPGLSFEGALVEGARQVVGPAEPAVGGGAGPRRGLPAVPARPAR
jgi:hypothetical protein